MLRDAGRELSHRAGRRRAAGWVLAAAGPALLGVALAATRSAHTSAIEMMLFLAACVAVALVGGRGPALLSAVLGVAVLNYWFTPPLRTWKVAQPEHVLALAVFALVAVAVSSVVDLAARRAEQAARSRAEADALSRLATAVLERTDPAAAVVDQLVASLGLTSARLLVREDDGAWRCVAAAGAPAQDAEAERVLPLSRASQLVLAGRVLSPDDERVLGTFVTHAALVLERERLRERAAQTQRLEDGLAIRTALLAAVSHDLRTPLASIKAAATSLLLPSVRWRDEDRDELLSTVRDSAEVLQRLVDNLLGLSRLQAGVVRPVLEPVALDEVVPAAIAGLPRGSVELDVPDDLPLVRTDAGLLERVLANVVQNGVRHAAASGRPVRVTGSPQDGLVVLTVVDHGPGVPDHAKRRMFEPFQRVGDAPAGAGTGLGLAVARGFAAALDASLTAQDTPGGGLTMVLAVPAA